MYELKPLRELEIGNIEVAQRRLIKRMIDEGLNLKVVFPINNFRYAIVKFKEKTIMLMYKREYFKSFGLQFRNKGQSGIGESINCEDLDMAMRFEVKEIYTVNPSGIAYVIPLSEFLKDGLYWVNKENKEILSISIHKFKRVFDLRLE